MVQGHVLVDHKLWAASPFPEKNEDNKTTSEEEEKIKKKNREEGNIFS